MKLWCKWFGHRWLGMRAMEHICIQDYCLRCGERMTIHASGPWGHTACPDWGPCPVTKQQCSGMQNDFKYEHCLAQCMSLIEESDHLTGPL